MKATTPARGGGARYPYPKEVWSPAGGWWTRPSSTWKGNTALVSLGIAGITWAIWNLSAEKEVRHVAPTKWIPSMMWSNQFTSGKMGVREMPDLPASEGGSSHH